MVKGTKKKLETVPPKLNVSDSTDTVLFSFEYLHEVSFTDLRAVNASFFRDFILRLKKLSQLGWKGIAADKRHGYGWEKIPVSSIRPKLMLSPSPEVDFLLCFRASGDNRVFLGVRRQNIFHILFIEAEFGDIYHHGIK